MSADRHPIFNSLVPGKGWAINDFTAHLHMDCTQMAGWCVDEHCVKCGRGGGGCYGSCPADRDEAIREVAKHMNIPMQTITDEP